MSLDGFTLKAIVRELNSQLLDSRIDKIHQPEKDELVFSIRQPKTGSCRLVISANQRWARIHLSSEKKPNPSQPTSFCMLLRKYLEGGKIKAITQPGLERIVHIRVEALNEFREWQDKLLVCEFMGRHANIILVNPDQGLILDAIKKVGPDELGRARVVLPGREYQDPPGQNKQDPSGISFHEFSALLWNQPGSTTIAQALFRCLTGLSPVTGRQICQMSGLDYNLPVEETGEYELNRLFDSAHELINCIESGNYTPTLQYRRHDPVDFTPYEPMELESNVTLQRFPTMNEACDNYFQTKLSRLRLESLQTNLNRNIQEHLNRAYKKKFLQEGDLNKAQENEKYKIWGELLTAYAHQFKKGDTNAPILDFYNDQEINLPLDPRYTPIQNAQRYFKIYNKSRGAQLHLQRLMAENQQLIDYLETVMVAVNQADSPAAIDEIVEELEKEKIIKANAARKSAKSNPSQPRSFISSDGLTILVGKNNRQNDRLTLKLANKGDLWLHTQQIPGTHVIISLPTNMGTIDDVPESTLLEAASLAAHYSKAGQSAKVPVDYTFRQNVKKPGGAKPGMVIYDNYWTVIVDPQGKQVSALLDQIE